MERFLEQQAREATIREQELALQRLDKENAHDYALKVLDAQLKDRADDRQVAHRATKAGGWVTGILLVGLFVLVGLAMCLNKDALLTELLRLLVASLGGGGFGYAIGRKKERDSGKAE